MRARVVRPAGAAVVVAALTAVLATGSLGPTGTRWLDDLGVLVAVTLAAGACVLRTRRSGGGARRSWLAMSAALLAALGGEALWAFIELVQDREVASPGLTDLFYLLFYPLALLALLLRPGRVTAGDGLRSVLESAMIAASCLAISAVTVLGPSIRLAEPGPAALAVTLAYPVGDVLLVTVLIIVMLRQPLRTASVLLATGLFVMGVADTAFAAMSLHDVSIFSSATDVAYIVGYLLIGEAALRDTSRTSPVATSDAPTLDPRLASNAPLVPAVCALAVGVWLMVTDNGDAIAAVAVSVVMALLVARQLVVQRQNKRLLSEVLRQQRELVQHAYHDQLTGLPNRRLFMDRLTHAVYLHGRNLVPLTVLLIDVDDFKRVNDTYGHAAGDEMLQAVADRLVSTTRRADTVARLGGDEFAVLMEGDTSDGDTDPCGWADWFLGLLDEKLPCQGAEIALSASVGIVTLSPDEATVSSDELLQRADTAMYRAKQAGKGRAVTYDPAATFDAESGAHPGRRPRALPARTGGGR